MKCLIVDDNESIIETFKFILETFGHEVLVATGQIGAIEILMTVPGIEFILTDNDMPQQNQGLEVVRQARIQFPNATVWMASGRMDRDLRNLAKARGANEGYEKPSEAVTMLKDFAAKAMCKHELVS